MSFRIDHKLFVIKDDNKNSIINLMINLTINCNNITSFRISFDHKLFVIDDDNKNSIINLIINCKNTMNFRIDYKLIVIDCTIKIFIINLIIKLTINCKNTTINIDYNYLLLKMMIKIVL